MLEGACAAKLGWQMGVSFWKHFGLPVQMAARETGFGAVEQYMHAGKLLALELLVRVLENPHHHWSALRPEVTAPQ